MNSVKELNVKEMKQLHGGVNYGNGVSCSKTKCSVNWGQAFQERYTAGINSFVSGVAYGAGSICRRP